MMIHSYIQKDVPAMQHAKTCQRFARVGESPIGKKIM